MALESFSKYTKELSDRETIVALMVSTVLRNKTSSDVLMKADMLINEINPIITMTNKHIRGQGFIRRVKITLRKEIPYITAKQKSRISKMVQWLRNSGHSPICSSQQGYWWGTTEKDIIKLARTQAQRSRSSWAVAMNMKQFLPDHRKYIGEVCRCGDKLQFECTESCNIKEE